MFHLTNDCIPLYDGAAAIRTAYQDQTGKELPEADDQEIEDVFEYCMKGYPRVGEELNDLLNAVFFESLYPTTWQYYDTPPAGLTKYDVLQTSGLLSRYTGGHARRVLVGEQTDEISELAQFKEFIADYLGLYEAIKAHIEERLPAARGLTANQYGKTIATWGELVDHTVWGCGYLVKPNDADVELHYWGKDEDAGTEVYTQHSERINAGGIAIIQNPSRQRVNKAGEYVEPDRQLNGMTSLDSLEENAADAVRSCLTVLVSRSLCSIYAYNALIDIMEELYDINDLNIVKVDTAEYESRAQTLNDLLYVTYAQISGAPNDIIRKRTIFRDVFKPIDIEKCKPSQAAIDEVKAELSGLGISKKAITALSHLEVLCTRLIGENAF